MRSDDLAPLLAAQGGSTVGIRQGTVIAWDPVSLANEISVGGASLINLPVLDQGSTALVTVGDSVIILTFNSSWLVLGRVVTP